MAYFFNARWIQVINLSLILLYLNGCALIAEATSPSKEPRLSHDRQELEKTFWLIFNEGDYEGIDSVLNNFKVSYLKNPKDPLIASRIAFLHAWRVTERARQINPQPTITDDLTMAARYFESAHILEPDNPITHGFFAAFALADGTIHHNDKKTTAAWFQAKEAIKAWPEFNQFTLAYLFNALPYDAQRSQMGIDLLNDVVQRCLIEEPMTDPLKFAQQLDRERPLGASAQEERLHRACANGTKAPFNIQGFLLNMADMHVRHGDTHNADRLYRTLAATKGFSNWPFKNLVSQRRKNLTTNVQNFRARPPIEKADVGMMFTSKYACMACHQTP